MPRALFLSLCVSLCLALCLSVSLSLSLSRTHTPCTSLSLSPSPYLLCRVRPQFSESTSSSQFLHSAVLLSPRQPSLFIPTAKGTPSGTQGEVCVCVCVLRTWVYLRCQLQAPADTRHVPAPARMNVGTHRPDTCMAILPAPSACTVCPCRLRGKPTSSRTRCTCVCVCVKDARRLLVSSRITSPKNNQKFTNG